MKKTRYFRIKRNSPWGGRKMKYVRMSPYMKGNYILSLLRGWQGEIVSFSKGDTFEFHPDEITEIK